MIRALNGHKGEGLVVSRAKVKSARIIVSAMLLCILGLLGCSVIPPTPTAQPQANAPPAAGKASVPVASPLPSMNANVPTTGGSALPPKPSPATTIQGKPASGVAGSTSKAPAKNGTSEVAVAKQSVVGSAAAKATKSASPTLNLTSLEQRLKDTKAIGVLTKLSLKNQVDDLLSQFRAFYQGTLKTTLAELRRPYDLLVLKVLSLLQDSDPPLASAIANSREAIWAILADRERFAAV